MHCNIRLSVLGLSEVFFLTVLFICIIVKYKKEVFMLLMFYFSNYIKVKVISMMTMFIIGAVSFMQENADMN